MSRRVQPAVGSRRGWVLPCASCARLVPAARRADLFDESRVERRHLRLIFHGVGPGSATAGGRKAPHELNRTATTAKGREAALRRNSRAGQEQPSGEITGTSSAVGNRARLHPDEEEGHLADAFRLVLRRKAHVEVRAVHGPLGVALGVALLLSDILRGRASTGRLDPACVLESRLIRPDCLCRSRRRCLSQMTRRDLVVRSCVCWLVGEWVRWGRARTRTIVLLPKGRTGACGRREESGVSGDVNSQFVVLARVVSLVTAQRSARTFNIAKASSGVTVFSFLALDGERTGGGHVISRCVPGWGEAWGCGVVR